MATIAAARTANFIIELELAALYGCWNYIMVHC
jgi:hypothetical protein